MVQIVQMVPTLHILKMGQTGQLAKIGYKWGRKWNKKIIQFVHKKVDKRKKRRYNNTCNQGITVINIDYERLKWCE